MKLNDFLNVWSGHYGEITLYDSKKECIFDPMINKDFEKYEVIMDKYADITVTNIVADYGIHTAIMMHIYIDVPHLLHIL